MDFFEMACAVVLWASAALVFYAYLYYPLLIWGLARCWGRRAQAPPHKAAPLPRLSLLIAAHNEAEVIGQRVRNALAMAYPPDKLEIVVASDGSSDETAAIVRRYAGRGVRLLEYGRRRGKAAVLNSAIPELKGDIVVLSDANTHMDPDAALALVRWFRDPAVGVVSGRLVLTDPRTGGNVDGLYWRYETFIKKCEGRLGALLGANGGIYAIRRELFEPIPNDTIVDDFVLPLQAKYRTGCAIVYDPAAVAREETPPTIGSEFHRRSRIGAGGFQSIGLLWRLLHPRHGWVAFTFLSHKVLRWLCPFFLVALVVGTACLWHQPLYRNLLLLQAAFYLFSFLAMFIPTRPRLLKALRLATMFTGMNAALLVGFWRWLRGNQKGVWRPTVRLAKEGALK